MPCTSPIKIVNPRKSFNPKYDRRVIDVPCGKCLECRKRYANDWRIRLLEEIKHSPTPYNYFITLSLSDEYYDEFKDNPRVAIRKFLERYRKKYKVSCRHWIVTELGDAKKRLHFHGILFDCKIPFDPLKPWLKRQNLDYTNNHLANMWKYGWTYVGYCNGSTASYIVKYINKPQYLDNGDFYKPKVYSSAGIGKKYTEIPTNVDYHRSLPDGQYTIKRGGFTYALPRYYKTRIWTSKELRLTQMRMSLIDRPFLLRGRTFPNNCVGYYQYMTNLSFIHKFNLTIYDPTRKKLSGVSR